MIEDYYDILGISPSASAREIKTAYKRRAIQCHPDRGGSHEEMVKVNLAYEILSDPDMRQRFDATRQGAPTESARHAAETDARAATPKAESYPKKWADFEKWMKSISQDFANAKFGCSSTYIPNMPTVSGSTSGVVFIALGTLIGAGIAILLFAAGLKNAIVLLFVVTVGANLGAGMHKLLGKAVKKISPPLSDSNKPEDRIVACGKCGQKLRLPNDAIEVKVTCPSCRFQFDH